ncbi:MFS transporter [Heyndrickxia sporothermodurans]|uniref:MFS transporter n=1 Tax=Heyndrickxia sporothermodurans TaxID=46224 RepID=UPI002DBDD370|nr:MFS transporter [Heyndrickxia sporothermodurans]MEB6550963.1 MFS transporter [Heyndrickxia sporothermodurans]MED3652134.1 MFS transporter [Heyndrickxia sporothermodurans]MED3696409.1 MFS transporter [Heyndrickxia sporothermodurans]MED3782556.1 MFS transporter [Heyndrickxia sporothermodurans]
MSYEAKTLVKESSTARSLLSNKGFLLLLVVSIVSGLSFSIYLLTETWYVINELNQQPWLGVVLIATTLPRVLFMSIGGVYADKWNRTNIMFYSLLIRGVLLTSMAIVFYFGLLDVYSLLIFATIFGLLDAFFVPANQSLLPQIVSKEQLMRGNSILQSTNQTVLIIGPIIGGLLIETVSYQYIFPIVAFFLITSSVIVKFIKYEDESNQNQKQSSYRDFLEGLHYVKTSKLIFTLMCVSMVLNFFIAGPGSLALPLIANDVLSGTALHLSALETSIALGMIGGAFLIGILNPRRKRGFIVLGQLFFLGIAMVLLSLVTTLWQGIIVFALIGLGITAGDIPIKTMIQEKTDPQKIGRVMGLMSTASSGLIPLSFGVTSLVISFNISISQILLVCGSFVICFFLIILLLSKKLRSVD